MSDTIVSEFPRPTFNPPVDSMDEFTLKVSSNSRERSTFTVTLAHALVPLALVTGYLTVLAIAT